MADLNEPTLWRLIEARAAATPGALLVVDEHDRELTFAAYRDACLRAAAGLAALGVGEGSAVSWQLPTWIESFVVVGALARLGAVQNPILPICRAREVGFITRQTRAELLLVPGVWRGFDYPAMAYDLVDGDGGPKVVVVDRELPDADPGSLPPVPTGDDDPVRFLFYTSGTTADPKGARHTDRTVAASARGVNRALDLGPDDRFGLVFPFTHVGGIATLFGLMMTGAAAIVVEAFDPEPSVEVLRRHGVTIAGAGTAFWLAFLHEQRRQPGVPIFPKLRAMAGGGSPKPPTLHTEIKTEVGGIGVASGYGLTECPSLALGTVRDPDPKLSVTDGRPAPGVEIRIVAEDGRVLPAGHVGEVRVRGPQLFKGYVDAALDTEAFDDDGFLRTGDLGRLDADGYLIISGRLKDIIIRKGENISAKEVEGILYAHPKIADVAVVGLPDPERGELACAVAVLAPGAGGLTLDEIGEWCRDHGLMVQKIPERLELVDQLPKNPAGKVLKDALRNELSA
ncbi:MAG TPA: AMP-binding protein [Acidimicrobiia bacterium]|nr:AMP-binding protein [Acidimicrobiia bacterium]